MNKNRYLSLLQKERKLIIAGALLGLIAFFAYVGLMYTPYYTTTTNLFIRNIPKNDVITSYEGPSTDSSESGYSNPLFNLVQILKSDGLSERIYHRLQKDHPQDLRKLKITTMDKWKGLYGKLLVAKIAPSSDIITVDFKWHNKKDTQELLNMIIEEFKAYNLEIRQSIEKKQRENLQAELHNIGEQLDTTRKHIHNYKLQNQNVDFSWQPNEMDEIIRSRVALEQEAADLKSRIAFNQSKYREMAKQVGFPNSQLALRATGVGQDAYILKLNQDLATSQQDLAKMKAKFTDNYPGVIAAKNEVSAIQDNINKRIRETLKDSKIQRGIYDQASQGVVGQMAQVEAEMYSSQAQYNNLENTIHGLQDKEKRIPTMLLGFDELQKREPALETAYNNTMQKYMQAVLNEKDIVDNIFMLGPPSTPTGSMKDLALKFLGVMAFFVMVPIGYAWVKEGVEDHWVDLSEMEQTTEKSILGTLPWLQSINMLESGKSLSGLDSPLMASTFAGLSRTLITKSYIENYQVLSFVSTATSRSQSGIVPSIAQSLVRARRSTLLISIGDELPAMEGHLQTAELDLSDMITEANKHIRLHAESESSQQLDSYIENLVRLSVNTLVSDTGENVMHWISAQDPQVTSLMHSKGFEKIMTILKRHYEFILFDTPAKLMFFSDASSVVAISDAAVILAAKQTSRDELMKFINQLEQLSVPILGIIAREQQQELEKRSKPNASKTAPGVLAVDRR